MAIFKKADAQPQKARERTPSQAKNMSGDATISIIGPAMRVIGDITTDGTVRVEGEVQGVINAGRGVILGQSGVITGDIVTGDAVIAGSVDGSIQASSRLELQSTSIVRGEIRTRAEHLTLEEGARFEGQVHMIGEDGPLAPPPAPPASNAATSQSGRSALDNLQSQKQSSYSGDAAIEDAAAVQPLGRHH